MNPQSKKVANRFSIRKYKTGAACVAIAALFLTSPAVMGSVDAAEVDTDDTATEVVEPEAEAEVTEDVTEEVLVEEPVEEPVVEDEAPVVEEDAIPTEEPVEAEVVIPETESEPAETVVPVEEPAETETVIPVEEPTEAEVTVPEAELEPAGTVVMAEEPVAEAPETEEQVVDVPVKSIDEDIVEDTTPVVSEEVVVKDKTKAKDAPIEKDESSEVEVPETEEDSIDTPEEPKESVDTDIVEDETPVASEEEVVVEDETEAEDAVEEEDNASKDEVEASDAEAKSDASEENAEVEEDKAEEIEADKRVSEAEIVEAIHWGDITDVPEVDTYIPKKYSDLYGDDINNDDYVINVDSIDYYKELIDYDALTGAQSFYNELLSQGRANAGVGAVQAKEHVQDFAFMKAVDMVMNRYFGSNKDGIDKTEYQESFFFGDDLPFNQDFERHTLNAARTSVDFGNDYKAAAQWFYDYMYANNKSHQETMNNADVTHAGLGIFRSYDGFTYVAQVLYKDGERNIPVDPEIPSEPEVPVTPEVPEEDDTETPSEPEVPVTPEVPEEDDTEVPSEPEVPVTPETPEEDDTVTPSEPEVPVTPEVPEEDNTVTPSELVTPDVPSDDTVEEPVTPAPSEDDKDTVKPVEPKPSDDNKEDDEEAITVPSEPTEDKDADKKPSNSTSTDKAPVVDLGPSKPVVVDKDTLPTSKPVIKVPVSTDKSEVGQTVESPKVPVSNTLLDTNELDIALTASDDAQSKEASVVAESTELISELDDAHVDAKDQQVDVININPSEEAQVNADSESEQAVESDNPSETSVTSLPDTGVALGAGSAILGSILALFGGSALFATRRRKDDK